MKKILVILSIIILITILLCVSIGLFKKRTEKNSTVAKVSYNFHIRPIFSDRCFACHGPDEKKRQGGLRLDVEEEAYKALKEHPRAHALVPGKPKQSELFLRITSTDTAIQMPPLSSHQPLLSASEISLIENWILQGAKYEKHWAFVAPVKPAVPTVDDKDAEVKNWVKNEIDHFVLKKLDEIGLAPNDAADKERLLKRVSLDITGLLPSPEQTDKFMADKAPDAYEKIVDELLQEPSYGERMAVPWLDIARYADSHGFQDDGYRTQWPWRDWVIHAFNNNMSYDKFVTWQLAGDLLPEPTKEQLLATAFNRNHKITEEAGAIDEEYRVLYVLDRTNTLGRGILGITLECAQCHDHKYDPISQQDYFSMYAFFNNIQEVGWESTAGGPKTFAKNPRMAITATDVREILKFVNRQDTNKLEVSIMKERDTLRKTFLLSRGNYDQPATEVQPGTPGLVFPFSSQLSKDRMGLCNWLFDPNNPLTARVFVNRIWQEFFKRGIVKSAADFGMQGDLPSHPELLDWLAVDFREHGWNIKRLIKQIVCSATYRQSSATNPDKQKRDPENIFLSHAPRVRMQAEFVRDIILGSSGLLNRMMGGPSSKPYQPEGLWELTSSGRGVLATYKQDTGYKLYRRGLYTFIKRTSPPPNMMIFDGSNRDQCEVKRSYTNTPLQSLVMLNDPVVLEACVTLADKLICNKEAPELSIKKAFRRIICRTPEKEEAKVLNDFLHSQIAWFASHPQNAEKILQAGMFHRSHSRAVELAAMMQVISLIYNMEEAITKT